jgi:hypothetical protein
LQDNLENATYQVFEKDPVKYVNYEEAVYQALVDRQTVGHKSVDGKVCVMVVGAGRGPLVMCSVRAAARAKQPVVLYAVEKNPNAVVYLNQVPASPDRQSRYARCSVEGGLCAARCGQTAGGGGPRKLAGCGNHLDRHAGVGCATQGRYHGLGASGLLWRQRALP